MSGMSRKAKADLYDYMLAVAKANGFESLTDAITRADLAQNAVDAFLAAGSASSLGGKVTFGTWSLDKLAKAFEQAARFRTVHPANQDKGAKT